jgi:hypothetical protein
MTDLRWYPSRALSALLWLAAGRLVPGAALAQFEYGALFHSDELYRCMHGESRIVVTKSNRNSHLTR